jgi:hypothetical protein
MAYDQERGVGDIADHQEQNLSNSLLNRLKRMRLSRNDRLRDVHREALVTFYRPELEWVFHRVLALGAKPTTAEDAVVGFYKRCLTRFITPYLVNKAWQKRKRRFLVRDTANHAVRFYAQCVTDQGGDLTQQNPFVYPRNVDKNAYVTRTRMVMLRENFMYFMKALRDRLNTSTAHISTIFSLRGAVFRNLTGLEFTGSDPHHGTQIVLILKYSNGKIVYKPRDTRIDEILVGRPRMVGPHPAPLTVAHLFNQNFPNTHGGRGYVIPLIKFLSCGDYGFMQYLETDFTHKEEKHLRRFSWLMGVYAGICMMFGVSDQHQSNIMVCKRTVARRPAGGRVSRHCLPHLTDLEIALRSHILSKSAQDDIYTRLKYTDILYGITKSKEEPEEAHWGYTPIGNTSFAKCTKITKPKESLTDNLPRISSNEAVKVHRKQYFRSLFSDGILDFYKTMRDHVHEVALNDIATLLSGAKSRFHALSTPVQLNAMRDCILNGELKTGNHSNVSYQGFSTSLKEDCNRLDVAYYVKYLGGGGKVGEVYHVTRGNNETLIEPGRRATGGNVIETLLRTYLQNLPDDTTLRRLKATLLQPRKALGTPDIKKLLNQEESEGLLRA